MIIALLLEPFTAALQALPSGYVSIPCDHSKALQSLASTQSLCNPFSNWYILTSKGSSVLQYVANAQALCNRYILIHSIFKGLKYFAICCQCSSTLQPFSNFWGTWAHCKHSPPLQYLMHSKKKNLLKTSTIWKS